MKGKTLSFLGIICAAVGVAIMLFFDHITKERVVVAGGILFVAVGLFNLILSSQVDKQKGGMAKVMSQISNAAAIVLGICMLVFQSTFTPLVTFIFGLLLAVCALWQFFVLAIGTRPYQLHGWLYVFPLLLGACSVYIFVQKADTYIMLVTGIGAAIMGLGCICEGIALGVVRTRKPATEGPAEAPQAPAPASPAPLPETAKINENEAETTDDLDAPASEMTKK